jgi:hypothetical protein
MKITKEQLRQIVQEELKEGWFDRLKGKSGGDKKPSDEFLAHQFLKNLEKTKMGKRSGGVSVRHDPNYAKAYARKTTKKLKEEDVLNEKFMPYTTGDLQNLLNHIGSPKFTVQIIVNGQPMEIDEVWDDSEDQTLNISVR